MEPTCAFNCLYIHVPFCRRKCGYCAFYSVPNASNEQKERYITRLRDELWLETARLQKLQTVYLGGGTPPVLDTAQLRHLLDTVGQACRWSSDYEFTVECNPEALTPEKLEIFVSHGVNRLSLGVQSFLPAQRHMLTREGDVAGVSATVVAARAAGARSVSADLIYAIPGQTLGQWEEDLRKAGDTGVDHLSAYSLTVEEGTRLCHEQIEPASDDLAVAMWERADDVLAAYGLRRYEISNFAKPGHKCRHNDLIWHGATYLGCGPAASSFDGRDRWTNRPDLSAWLAGAAADKDSLPTVERAAEILAFGLRTVAGWDRLVFAACTGFDCLELRGPQIQQLADDGLLQLTPSALRPTRKGLLFADLVAEELL